MLARTPEPCQTPAWKRELAEAYRRPEDLLADLGLPARLAARARPASGGFPFLVPRAYAARMRHGEAHDPLLRQVLPSARELTDAPGYCGDPVGDTHAQRLPGLLQKYAGRALLLLTGACAVHCRYCLRRHFPYADGTLAGDRGEAALRAIAAEAGITEVILSGGDPLTWDDHQLGTLIERLSAIPHLRRLRVHTRLPVVLPSRVTPQLCASLAGSRLKTLVVVHVNHPRELSDAVRGAFAALCAGGTPLLNQSVLLRGVNDDAGTLAELSEGLFDCGVLPYYLHLLDPVSGAAHFEVPAARARGLLDALRAALPGYLVPRLVRETPGAACKQPVA